MKTSTTDGIDNNSAKLLKKKKNTKEYSSIILSKIFSQSLEQKILPENWKVGKVIPLHKDGGKQSFYFSSHLFNEHSMQNSWARNLL